MNRSHATRLKSYKHVVSSIFLIMLVGGCASKDFVTPEEHYHQVIEQQRAGVTVNDQPLSELPEMNTETYEQFGDSSAQQGNFAMAASYYEKVLEEDPENVPIRYKLANVLLQRGMVQPASERFQKILKDDPTYALAHQGLGETLLRTGEDTMAAQEFRKAVAHDPKLWRSHNYLGIALDRKGLHLSAIKSYHEALALHPGDPSLMNNLGMAYYLNGEEEKSAWILQQAHLAAKNEHKIANNLGLVLSKMKRYDEAYDAFRQGTDSAKAYNNLGVIMLESGKPRRAAACFEKAIETRPTFYEEAKENLIVAERALKNPAYREKQETEPKYQACI